MENSFDAIVIGAGQAGPSLAARLAAAGRRTVLIEREHLGGTCVNDGCMPTKTMVASARAAWMVRRAADWGVHVDGPVRVDLAAVKARKDRIVAQSTASLAQWLGAIPDLKLVWGHARFVAPRTVQVGDECFSAPWVFINTGGRALIPAWPGIDTVPVLTNTSLMALTTLPGHLVVAGASYIGLEFAQMFRRFGSQVSVLEVADRAVAREDASVSRTLQAILAGEGIAFHFGVRAARVRREGAQVRIDLESSTGAQTLHASHLLAAIGRRPNTDDLGLDAAGIATDSRGFVVVDEQLRTPVAGVWALGDVHGRGAFTHTSYNDHEIVADNLLAGAGRGIDERIPAYALFTDPPLARIGWNEAAARASGRRVLVGRYAMARVGRARERGETQGFMQVLVDAATDHIVGATLLGIEADEVVHVLLTAMAAGMTAAALRRTVLIHPTVGELLPTLLADLQPLEPEEILK